MCAGQQHEIDRPRVECERFAVAGWGFASARTMPQSTRKRGVRGFDQIAGAGDFALRRES